jgi:hypothetical protein
VWHRDRHNGHRRLCVWRLDSHHTDGRDGVVRHDFTHSGSDGPKPAGTDATGAWSIRPNSTRAGSITDTADTTNGRA